MVPASEKEQGAAVFSRGFVPSLPNELEIKCNSSANILESRKLSPEKNHTYRIYTAIKSQAAVLPP